MPKLKGPVIESPIACNILNELEAYALSSQFYPTKHALYRYIARTEINLSFGKFSHWFDRLVEEDYIRVDPYTHAIRSRRLKIAKRQLGKRASIRLGER